MESDDAVLAALMRQFLIGEEVHSGLRRDHLGRVVALVVDGEVLITPEQIEIVKRIWDRS